MMVFPVVSLEGNRGMVLPGGVAYRTSFCKARLPAPAKPRGAAAGLTPWELMAFVKMPPLAWLAGWLVDGLLGWLAGCLVARLLS